MSCNTLISLLDALSGMRARVSDPDCLRLLDTVLALMRFVVVECGVTVMAEVHQVSTLSAEVDRACWASVMRRLLALERRVEDLGLAVTLMDGEPGVPEAGSSVTLEW